MGSSLVSVLMLTYNHEKYVGKAIESILIQNTDFLFELIIGEDFSTDSTREICLKFARNNPDKIKLLSSEQNLGMLPNFIRTLTACDGEYIAFCEGDDYWTDPLKLQKQVDFLKDKSDCAIVHTKKKVLVGETLYDDAPENMNYSNIAESLFLSNKISFLTLLARAEILKKCVKTVLIHAKERNWRMLDYPLGIFIGINYNIGFLNEVTVVYRLLPESASHSSDKRKAYLFDKYGLDVKEYYFKIYQKQNQQIAKIFRYRFKENIFHSRKRMILDYGFIAKSELVPLLATNPLLYIYIISKKLKSLF
jgi:glycosyltransferase involved in cell wall biosynthesis